jgi:hypothetical protein
VRLASVTETGTLLTAFAGHEAVPFGAPFSLYSTEALRVISQQGCAERCDPGRSSDR